MSGVAGSICQTRRPGPLHRLGAAALRMIMRRIGAKSSPALRRFIVMMSSLHVWVYRRTHGRIGGRLGLADARMLLLTTTGRRTGAPRTVPLLAIGDGDDLVVVASHGGLDQPPGWWVNLDANPEAVVELGNRRFTVRAEQADQTRRAELWPRFVRAFPGYDDYRQRTTRELPIMILRPRF
jgi:F420H(2)-dependent quinone reductase